MAARRTWGRPGDRSSLALQLRNNGLSYKEIAERLGVAEGTVHSLVYNARAREPGFKPRPRKAPSTRQVRLKADEIRIDKTPGCPRCWLRGKHECIGRAENYLGRREDVRCVRNRTS
jgi:hypothetical protein